MPTTIFTPQPLASTIAIPGGNLGCGLRRFHGRQVAPVDVKNHYYRTGYEWSYHQTADNTFNWTKFDAFVADSWLRGMTASIMIADMRGRASDSSQYNFGGTYVPSYLAVAPRGILYDGAWFPNYDDDVFMDEWDAWVVALYNHVKNDYRVESVHIPLGKYGEWYLGTVPGYTAPSAYALKRRVDSFKVFNTGTHVRVVMMTDDADACRYALKFAGPATLVQPWGWARYSLGKTAHFNRLDTDKFYVGKLYRQLEAATSSVREPATKIRDDAFAAEFRERYKVAPVETETYGAGMDTNPFTALLADARKWHLDYTSNGNFPGETSYWNALPQEQRDLFLQAGREMGYRITLSRVEISTLEPGKPFTVTATWQNTGVGPTKHPWTPTFRFKSGSTIAWEGASAYKLSTLLPGQTVITSDTFTLASIATGTYTADVNIKHGRFPAQLPALALANIGVVTSDRTLPLGSITTGTTGGNVSSQITEVGDPVISPWTWEDLEANMLTVGITRQPETLAGDVGEIVIGANLSTKGRASIAPTISGWTPVRAGEINPGDVALFVYQRKIEAGDSSTITITFDVSADLTIVLNMARGVDASTPVETSAGAQSTTATTAITSPAVTPTSNNGLRRAYVAIAGGWDSTSLNANQPMTERFNDVRSAVEMTLLGGTEQLGTVSGVAQPTRGWTAQYAAQWASISTVLRAATVTALTAPTNVIATPISTSQINVSWTAVTGAAVYQVDWAENAAGPWLPLVTTASLSTSHLSLPAATTRHYRVKAQNSPSRIDSPYSATVQATTQGGVITGQLNPIKTDSGMGMSGGVVAKVASLSITKPAEATAGREMWIHIGVRNTGSLSQQTVNSSQTGWTKELASHRDFTIGAHSFRRKLDGNATSEPNTLTFTWSTAEWTAWAYEVFENPATTILDVASSGNGDSTSTSYGAGTLAPTDGTFYLFVTFTAYALNNVVAPPNYTEQQEPKSAAVGGVPVNITGHIAFWNAGSAQQHTPAASGPAASYVAQVFALRGAGIAAVVIPAAPTSLIVSVVTTTISATWTDAANNEAGYRVLLSRDNGNTWEVVKDALAANTTSYSITGLSPGAYRVGIEAYNSAGPARTTSSLVTVNASTTGTSGGLGRERLHLAVYAERDGRMLADWTAIADNAAWSTGERGYQDLTCFVPMSRQEGKRWQRRPVLHVEVSAGASEQWEGRLEDVKPVPGGIQIKVMGYAAAFTDNGDYTSFWVSSRFKDSQRQYWQVLEDGFFPASRPERFQVSMGEKLLITTRTNSNHGPAVICYVAFSVPAASRNLIHFAKWDYTLTAGTGWECGLVVYDANWQPGSPASIWVQPSEPSSALVGSQTLAIPAGAHRLAFYFRYTATSTTVQIPDDPGRYQLLIENLRIAAISGPVTADLIIKDVLASTRELQASLSLPEQLSARTDQIGAPGLELPDACWEGALASKVIDDLLPLGDNQTPPRRWALRVWNDGGVHFQPEGTGRRWRIKWASDPQTERSLADLRNSYDVIHENKRGDQVRTGASVNEESARRWGLVRQETLTLDTVSSAQARAQRDLYVAESEEVPTRATPEVEAVFTEQGVPVPLWLVKAGDIAIPMQQDTFSDEAEFIIAETHYSPSTKKLTISATEPIPSMETTVARSEWGIR